MFLKDSHELKRQDTNRQTTHERKHIDWQCDERKKKKFIMRLIPIEVEMEIGKILFLVYDYNAEIELNIHQAAREMEEWTGLGKEWW